MSKLNTHFFNIDDAEQYGVTPAVLLYNLRYLQEQKANKNKDTHDGKHWVNYSYQALADRFSYLSPSQVKRTMKKLLDSGAVISEQISPNPWDRTLYWHVTDMAISTDASDEIAKCTSDEVVPCHETKSSSLIHDNNITNITTEFADFWKAYPNKKSKMAAERKWKKISPEDRALALADVSVRSTKDKDWIKDGGKYIPHPSTYLNSGGWLDEWAKEDSVPAWRKELGYYE
jgi:DNA-binding Lrp family transcriptional regulator